MWSRHWTKYVLACMWLFRYECRCCNFKKTRRGRVCSGQKCWTWRPLPINPESVLGLAKILINDKLCRSFSCSARGFYLSEDCTSQTTKLVIQQLSVWRGLRSSSRTTFKNINKNLFLSTRTLNIPSCLPRPRPWADFRSFTVLISNNWHNINHAIRHICTISKIY